MHTKSFLFVLFTMISIAGMDPNQPSQEEQYEYLQLLVAKELFLYLLKEPATLSNSMGTRMADVQLLVPLQDLINSQIFKDIHKVFFTNCCPFDTYKWFALKQIANIMTYLPTIYTPEEAVLGMGTVMFPESNPEGICPRDHLIYMLQKMSPNLKNSQHISL